MDKLPVGELVPVFPTSAGLLRPALVPYVIKLLLEDVYLEE